VQLVGLPTRIGGRVTGERADPPEDVCDCQQMWPIWGALITARLAEIVLILVERRTSSPMLPLELFSSSTFSAANVVGLLLNGWILRATLLYQSVLPEDQGLLATAGWPGLAARDRCHLAGRRAFRACHRSHGAAGFLSMCLTDATTPRDQPRWNGKLQDDGMRA
jgi:hypothetical protein